jgi:ElaA protein
LKEEDTKEELIKSIKKTLKMQTLIKKWDDLSIDEVQSIFGLRSEVFIVEQECPYQDVDGRDAEADHLLLYENNILCGYTRIFPKNTYFADASFGRTVVKKTHRGRGYGHVLVKKSLKHLKNKKENTIKISAQSYLIKFYASHGFIPKGDEYLEDNIPHTAMFLTFS